MSGLFFGCNLPTYACHKRPTYKDILGGVCRAHPACNWRRLCLCGLLHLVLRHRLLHLYPMHAMPPHRLLPAPLLSGRNRHGCARRRAEQACNCGVRRAPGGVRPAPGARRRAVASAPLRARAMQPRLSERAAPAEGTCETDSDREQKHQPHAAAWHAHLLPSRLSRRAPMCCACPSARCSRSRSTSMSSFCHVPVTSLK